MEKSKLLDIFKSIPTKEYRLFLEYVQSPYFNKRKDVVLLCQYLIKQARANYPTEKLKHTHCWQALFPDINYDKKEMAYLMSRLNHLAESFLGQRNFEKRESIYPILSLESLAESRLEKHYQQKLKKIKQGFESSTLEDSNKIWLQYRVAEIEDFYFNLQNNRLANPYITKKNDFLDQFFTQRKLQIFCTIQNIKKILGIELNVTWPKFPSLQNSFLNQSLVYKAYYFLYQLLLQKDNTEAQFLMFKSLLPSLKGRLSHSEYIDIYYFAINYCLVEINKGKRVYTKHLFLIYEEGLSQKSLLINDELSPWIYKNIVNLGLGLKRFNWTEIFIQKYSNKLPLIQRSDAYFFNLANLNFYQQNYDEALYYLSQVVFTDIYYKHGSKGMLLEIYFLKNESEAFYSLESSFKILLIRDKTLPIEIKNTYLNFIRFIAKLYKLKNNKDKHKLLKLRTKIEQTPNIYGKNWILGQLQEIERK